MFLVIHYLFVWADKVADARWVPTTASFECSVQRAHRAILIAQEVERKRVFLRKRPVSSLAVTTYADDDSVFRAEVLDSVTESLALSGSAWGVGLWIPPQQ